MEEEADSITDHFTLVSAGISPLRISDIMKVYLRSYKIPTVLIIMGALMCIAASLTIAEHYISELFWFGAACMLLGIFGWLSVQLGNYMAKRRVRAKVQAKKAAPQTKSPTRVRQYPF